MRIKKLKFYSIFFKKLRFQKAEPLSLSAESEIFCRRRAFLLLFAIEKEAEFEAEPHICKANPAFLKNYLGGIDNG